MSEGSVAEQFREPECLDAAVAAELVEEFARGERLCAAGKALAARRVEATGTWRAEGYRSAAHWLANTSGVTVGAGFRAGELSEVQFREVAEAAASDPGAEAAPLAVASESLVKALRAQCRQVRAQSVADDAAWAAAQQVGRRLHDWTDDSGSYRGDWKLAPDMGARVRAALKDEIDQIWRAARREGRHEPRGAYAADALVNLVTRGPLRAPEVKMTTDHTAIERGYLVTGEKCEIEGIGPVPITVARAILQDARVSVLVRQGDDIRHLTSPKPTIPRRFRRRLENLWRIWRHCHRLKTYLGWRPVLDERGRRKLVPP